VTTLRLCPCCAGPLPLPASGEAEVQCGFCEARANLLEARFSVAPELRSETRRRAENRAFRTIEAFKAARARGVGSRAAIGEAARAELGPMGRTDTLERVVIGLAQEFERATRTQIVDDPVAMARLLEGYLQGVSSIRLDGACHLCLPFLASSEQGPVHFERCLTVSSLAELAERELD
jgi:hypothetical protein